MALCTNKIGKNPWLFDYWKCFRRTTISPLRGIFFDPPPPPSPFIFHHILLATLSHVFTSFYFLFPQPLIQETSLISKLFLEQWIELFSIILCKRNTEKFQKIIKSHIFTRIFNKMIIYLNGWIKCFRFVQLFLYEL